MACFEDVVGRYVTLDVAGEEYRVYFEEAGEGIPVLCQHTAGSDSRQWRHILADPELTKEFRFIAHDLPFHGRSLPPLKVAWWSERYSLSKDFLLEFVTELTAALAAEGGIYMGCSMGGHLAADIALEHPGLFRAVLAIQGSLATHGRGAYDDYVSNPRSSNEMKAALMLGQTSPASPERLRREIAWVYSQGAPQVLHGDLDYYLDEHDVTATAGRIDTSRTEVHVMAGEYDWSATPERAKALADAIPGATYTRMNGIGHFPMAENPEGFKQYAVPLLRSIAARGAVR